MTGKTAKIVSYLTWIGWLIVLITGAYKEDEGVKQHFNQATICVIACLIPIGITQLAALVFAVWGIIKACQEDDSPLPLIGGWCLFK